MIAREFVIAATLAIVVLAACGPTEPTAQPGITPSNQPLPPTSAPATPPRLEAPPAAASPGSQPISHPVSTRAARALEAPPGTPTPPVTRPAGQAIGRTATLTPDSTQLAVSGVKVCHAADLTGSVGFQGATQALAGNLTLTNRGTSPCSVEGPPEVQLIDAKGQALAVKDVTPPDAGPSQRVVIQPGQPAYVRLFWREWCGAEPSFPVQVRADWPDSGGWASTLLASGPPRDQHPLDQTPVCNVPGSVSTLSVYPFRATP